MYFNYLYSNYSNTARLDMAALSDAFPLLTLSSVVRYLGVTLDCQLTFFHSNEPPESRLPLSIASTPRCHSFAYSICNLHPCAMCMPSLQTGWPTAARPTLASLLVDWGPWIGSCVLLPA